MREYKGSTIPNRYPRDGDYILNKQSNYCSKSDCDRDCVGCLFYVDNLELFKEWYLRKNKVRKDG